MSLNFQIFQPKMKQTAAAESDGNNNNPSAAAITSDETLHAP